MATYNEQLQRVWHQYTDEHGGTPATLREAVAWGVEQRLIEPPEIDPLDKVISDMGRALREEYRTDEHGRRYRVNHAARITKDGVQFVLWAEMATAPRDHMLKAFAGRRNQIVGECIQLKRDVNVYNGMHSHTEPIQMPLDFTPDVEENEILEQMDSGMDPEGGDDQPPPDGPSAPH